MGRKNVRVEIVEFELFVMYLYSGLTMAESLFQALCSPEGLVDTAVENDQTQYMSQGLIKFLGHLSAACDYTVLTSSSGFFQFQYWGDNFDPVTLEGNAQGVIFNRTFYHSEVRPLFSSIHLLPYLTAWVQRTLPLATPTMFSSHKV